MDRGRVTPHAGEQACRRGAAVPGHKGAPALRRARRRLRRERYIGICYGPPGVGKTLSARHYAAWDQLEPWLDRHRIGDEDSAAPDVLAHSRTALYTPTVGITPSRIHHEVQQLGRRLDYAIDDHLHPTRELFRDPPERSYVELLIVARITNGNFRLVNRLFAQINRVLEINNLATITREVIETAREGLVIGQP